MLKKLLILILFVGAANSALGMGYLFEKLGKQEARTSSSEPMSLEKKYYLDFKNRLKSKLDQMPKDIYFPRNENNKEKLEELKKVVGINFAKEYEAANKKDLASKAYQSIKTEFIADGMSSDDQYRRTNDIQQRYGLLLGIIYQLQDELADQTKQPKARL